MIEDDLDVVNIDEDNESAINDSDKFKYEVDKNDRSAFELCRWIEKGKLRLDPEWQREFVWDEKRQSRLIESILLGIPIPVIYLAEVMDNDHWTGIYEVIDGKQRITTINRFIKGLYALKGLGTEFKKYNGQKFGDIELVDQSKIEDTTLRTFEIKCENNNVLYDIFERLNTGGLRLNDMEIRNCIYRGKLMKLIHDIASRDKVKEFFSKIGVSGDRMEDRNMILHYIAFYVMGENFKGKAKRTINEFCKNYQDPKDGQLREWDNKFKESIDIALSIFDSNVSKLYNPTEESFKNKHNVVLFQVQMVSFARFDKKDLLKNADSIYEDFLSLCDENNDIEDNREWAIIFSKARSGTHLKTVLDAYKIYSRRIESIIKSSANILDATRLFSKDFKRQLYSTNNTCKNCHQEIKSIDSAEVDHHVPYWRGGQTIPENARLLHRRCNREKSGK